MKPTLILLALLVVAIPLQAQQAQPTDSQKFFKSPRNSAPARWPGLTFSIVQVLRISSDRLLVQFLLTAGPKASPKGTLIGIPVPVPKNATLIQIEMHMFHPLPYSFQSSTMTDDATQAVYPTLPPDPHPHIYYPPSQILATLPPFRSASGTMQFPSPPIDPQHPDAPQTISVLFTNALRPISHIPLPPPNAIYPTGVPPSAAAPAR